MYQRNDSLGIDPFWVYKYAWPTAQLPEFVWSNFVESPKKPEEVKYRFLTDGEVAKKGDEVKCEDGAYRTYSFLKNSIVRKACEEHRLYRRPIRMQDATHRFLDIEESIKPEDEVGLNSWHCTYRGGENVRQVDDDAGQLYRRKLEETTVEQPKPETKAPLADDYNYRCLLAGELTKEGDEVYLGANWAKCLNGNINAVVTKFHETERLYRRPKTPEPDNTSMQDLWNEIETLKDQLANSMAEVNELKEKLRDTEVAVNVYTWLQGYLGVIDMVRSTVVKMCLENGELRKSLRKYEPQYIYLRAGDLLEEGDEYQSPITEGWHPTFSNGRRVGDSGTWCPETGKPYYYRRKVK